MPVEHPVPCAVWRRPRRGLGCVDAPRRVRVGTCLVVLSIILVSGMAGAPRALAAGWSIQRQPPAFGPLTAVSCPSPRACIAAGDQLPLRWGGSRWSALEYPYSGPYGATITGVSCPSPTECTFALSAASAGGLVGIVARWDGRWSVDGALRDYGVLAGVSCASQRLCIGVGSYVPACHGLSFGDCTSRLFHTVTLAERVVGTGLSIQRTPNPIGQKDSTLTGVSCPSATMCAAVGSFHTSTGRERLLVERWTGTRWVIERIVGPAVTTSGSLSGVSCSSQSACVAVGSFGDRAGHRRQLVLRWAGSRWSTRQSLTPAGATASELSGVSCHGPSACTAVGSYQANGRTLTLVERWNGNSWSIQRSPNHPAASANSLSGVSCPSPATCTAVGSYTNGRGSRPLIERWVQPR